MIQGCLHSWPHSLGPPLDWKLPCHVNDLLVLGRAPLAGAPTRLETIYPPKFDAHAMPGPTRWGPHSIGNGSQESRQNKRLSGPTRWGPHSIGNWCWCRLGSRNWFGAPLAGAPTRLETHIPAPKTQYHSRRPHSLGPPLDWKLLRTGPHQALPAFLAPLAGAPT